MSFDARREGYGLTLSYNPKGPLAHLDLLDDLAQLDCPSKCHYIFKPDGQIAGYFGNAFIPNRGFGQRGNLRIPRQVLRRLLMDRIKAKVVFGKLLIGLESVVENKICLKFGDGSNEENVDLLIGADGIRSSVVKLVVPNVPGPKYLGVMIILGIAEFNHPLLDERGFYTLDGNHRLFTMPYEERSSEIHKARVMWQLSYNLADEDESRKLSLEGPKSLRDEVLRRCRYWHDPVVELIHATSLETIWGTGLMDRDPEELVRDIAGCKFSNVVVLGDAAHSMSPFKGQGANQALTDGPLLASWLERASICTAVKCFHREMATRTGVKVRASREAAGFLHSPMVLLDPPSFAGVSSDTVRTFLETLKNSKVGSWNGSHIDTIIRQHIDENRTRSHDLQRVEGSISC